MKKLLAFLMAFMMLGALVAGCGGGEKKEAAKPAAGAKKFINIATGGTAGTYYPLGGALADILNKNVPNANASAQSTGASVANVNLLKEGKLDLYNINGKKLSYDSFFKPTAYMEAECFLLGKKELGLLYAAGELAPYSEGATYVVIHLK